MKKAVLAIAILVLSMSCLVSCENEQKGQENGIALGFYQIDKAQEFNEYSGIGVTLEDNGLCKVDFSMTGDSFSGFYTVKQNTLTLNLDTLCGEYINDTDIDIKYIFDISKDNTLVFKKYEGDSIKYTYNITGEEMTLKETMHFEKGDNFILQSAENNESFEATVLEASEYYLIVEPLENEDERKSSDKISLDIGHLSQSFVPEVKVGDNVEIVYDGVILETYPAQLGNVFFIKLLD